MFIAPPLMSPPIRFASMRSRSRGSRNIPSQDAIAKTRRKTLDLRFEAICHIDRRSVWHMTISPQSMLPLRRAARVEGRWLSCEHERPFRMLALQYRVLRLCNLFKGTPEMNGDGAFALCRTPRHRLRKSVVNFEDSRSRFEAFHQAAEIRL